MTVLHEERVGGVCTFLVDMKGSILPYNAEACVLRKSGVDYVQQR